VDVNSIAQGSSTGQTTLRQEILDHASHYLARTVSGVERINAAMDLGGCSVEIELRVSIQAGDVEGGYDASMTVDYGAWLDEHGNWWDSEGAWLAATADEDAAAA
jgi:hypothetical protein